jgi:hypothetical protein
VNVQKYKDEIDKLFRSSTFNREDAADLSRYAGRAIAYCTDFDTAPPVQMFTGTPQFSEDTPAVKFDSDKPRYDLLPPFALEAIAKVLQYGANKYGARNWEKGLAWGRMWRAGMGHMLAFWRGEELDQESKLPHLWHAGCCILMLIEYTLLARYVENDDRSEHGKD